VGMGCVKAPSTDAIAEPDTKAEWVWHVVAGNKGDHPSITTLVQWRTELDGGANTSSTVGKRTRGRRGRDGTRGNLSEDTGDRHAHAAAATPEQHDMQHVTHADTLAAATADAHMDRAPLDHACAHAATGGSDEASFAHAVDDATNDVACLEVVAPLPTESIRRTHVVVVERTRTYQALCCASLRSRETMVEIGSAYGDCLAAARSRHGAMQCSSSSCVCAHLFCRHH
jgi:hypothetical protein